MNWIESRNHEVMVDPMLIPGALGDKMGHEGTAHIITPSRMKAENLETDLGKNTKFYTHSNPRSGSNRGSWSSEVTQSAVPPCHTITILTRECNQWQCSYVSGPEVSMSFLDYQVDITMSFDKDHILQLLRLHISVWCFGLNCLQNEYMYKKKCIQKDALQN